VTHARLRYAAISNAPSLPVGSLTTDFLSHATQLRAGFTGSASSHHRHPRACASPLATAVLPDSNAAD
jgi:hypothetical protein